MKVTLLDRKIRHLHFAVYDRRCLIKEESIKTKDVEFSRNNGLGIIFTDFGGTRYISDAYGTASLP